MDESMATDFELDVLEFESLGINYEVGSTQYQKTITVITGEGKHLILRYDRFKMRSVCQDILRELEDILNSTYS